ncbi:VanZ family protein [Amycolatopsis roodepoortensis]|uniref:Glycopeptide antibiotics resistance protein n=1 Tax=Amycolatopsis roodepoortensis TaxID=700274 RepID=A0ABR9L2D8_9PSEU|nr:VanZ family protein [Amycolatopsis roodepoortensis]MBE1574891.1 glycopeptide antibiotics resistance protein [Amycolatopsis roodepoortensis]
MGELLRAFGGMIPLTIIAIPYALLGWPLLAAHRRRRRADPFSASATAAVDMTLALACFLVLCLVTMPVTGVEGSRLNLEPGTDLRLALTDSANLWQALGNVLMLSPLGALLPVRSRRLRSLARIALGALAVSVLVEGTQYLIQAGRVTSADDILLNTLGAVAGAALSKRLWHRLDVRPPVRIPVQVRRVCAAPVRLRVPRSAWDERYSSIAHPQRR